MTDESKDELESPTSEKSGSQTCEPVTNTTETVLYYDGACGLCSHEMTTLRKYANRGLCLKDIHTLSLEEQKKLPSKKKLLMFLHARTTGGQWVTGADANVLAWQYTRFGKLFKILRWPLIKPTIDFFYAKWAVRRYDANVSKGLYKDSV